MNPTLYLDALDFAARSHGEAKTPKGLPYVVHLASVAMEVSLALRHEAGRDEDLAIACALLHDVLEDTDVGPAALEARFGSRVAAGVRALTKDAALPKERRMDDSLARILLQPREIAMVKLADRVTNLAPPPEHWAAEKVAAYREEGRVILERLGSASPWLSARLAERLARYPGR